MDAVGLFELLTQDAEWAPLVQASIELAPSASQFADFPDLLETAIVRECKKAGIGQLYTHQAACIRLLLEGKDVAVVTGTGSGKSLCYQLPVLQACLQEPAARALFIFPTKALAHDQLGKLDALLEPFGLRSGAYDGDTPKSARAAVRNSAHIVLTNPDMLHVGILPGHENWTKFLRSLRYIVVDEMHTYRGVFGSHVALILRRLLRLCEWHGSRPRIVACSATISNPLELFGELTGRVASIVDRDGAPGSRRQLVVMHPDLDDSPASWSPNRITGGLLAWMVDAGSKAMAFSRSRIASELVARNAKGLLERPEQIDSYRGGYTPKERRAIEQALFKGTLRGISTTSAMELGVDVGNLDAVIINGYPGTRASFWQQCGRAGRSGNPGLAVLIPHADPLEMFLARDPAQLVLTGAEAAIADPGNPYVQAQQLRCACYERALSQSEVERWPGCATQVAREQVDAGELVWSADRYYFPSHVAPASQVSIRGMGGKSVTVMCGTEVLTELEEWRAPRTVYPGAIYLHRATPYQVRRLDMDGGYVEVEPFASDWYTLPLMETIVEPGVEIDVATTRSARFGLIGARLTSAVVGFKRIGFLESDVLAVEELAMPPTSFDTIAVRIDLPLSSNLTESEAQNLYAGVHGVEHALVSVAPLIAGCDPVDLESAWYAASFDTLSPTIYVLDAIPGGVGLAQRLFEDRAAWFEQARKLLGACECLEGCPYCLWSSRCPANNQVLSKSASIGLLGGLHVE